MVMRSPWAVVWTSVGPCRVGRVPAPYFSETGPSALMSALTSARQLARRNRTLAVVLEQHEPWWKRTLRTLPEGNVCVEPINRGSASGVLLALVRIFRWDPMGSVALIATDLPVEDCRANVLAAREALTSVSEGSQEIFATDNGPYAKHCSMVIGSAQSFVELFMHAKPLVLKTFLAHLSGKALWDASALESFYPFLPYTDFREHVLAAVPDRIRLISQAHLKRSLDEHPAPGTKHTVA